MVLLKRANTPLTVLFAPGVLFKSAPAPVAVMSAMLAKSVRAPTAVEAADFVAVDREGTNGCIVCSAREIKKGVLPFCGVAA